MSTTVTEDLTVDHEVVDTTLSSRTRMLRAAAYAVLGLISLVWLGLAVDGGTAHLVFDGHSVGLPAKATVIVVGIPVLGPDMRNEAARFKTLIDALYEHKVKLLAGADAEPAALYPAGDGAFEFERTVSRLMEMQSQDYLAAGHGAG